MSGVQEFHENLSRNVGALDTLGEADMRKGLLKTSLCNYLMLNLIL